MCFARFAVPARDESATSPYEFVLAQYTVYPPYVYPPYTLTLYRFSTLPSVYSVINGYNDDGYADNVAVPYTVESV
jgi:hypothetical protein